MATTDTWRSLRASQWWHFTALPLVTLPDLSPASCRRVPLALLLAACCLAVAYAVNAVTDRRSDRLAAKNPLVRAPWLVPRVLRLALRLALLAAVLAHVLGAWASAAAATSLLAGLAYSTSVCGKRTPLLGVACNAAIFTPLALLLHPGGPLAPASVAELLLFTLLLAQNQLLHELADAGEDAAAGARTTARWLGPARTRALLIALGLAAALAAALLVHDPRARVVGLALGALAPLLAAGRPPAAARRAHRVLTLIAGAALFLLQRVP